MSKPERMTYHFSSKALIRSCPLPKFMISYKGQTNNSLTVTAEKIEPLSTFLKRHKKHLEYEVMESFIASIGRQLQYLERENMGVASFNIDDITVFHNSDDNTTTVHFAMTNEDKIHEINEDNQLVINVPYLKEYTNTATITTKNKGFHSPEFKEFISKKIIPYNIHFKSGYYSFGLLCIYCYLSRTVTTATATATEKDITDILAPIINTKI